MPDPAPFDFAKFWQESVERDLRNVTYAQEQIKFWRAQLKLDKAHLKLNQERLEYTLKGETDGN